MKLRSIRRAVGVVVMIAVVILFGVTFNQGVRTASHSFREKEVAPTIQSAKELKQVLKGDAIVFIDADWSFDPAIAKPVVRQLRELVEANRQFEEVAFRTVDCTNLGSAVCTTLKDWLITHESDGSVVTAGRGTLVWIKDGKAADLVYFPATTTKYHLVQTTGAVYGSRRKSAPATEPDTTD